MDNVLPRGTYVEFYSEEYLEDEAASDEVNEVSDSSEMDIEENTGEQLANSRR